LTFIDPAPFYKLAERPEWLLGNEEGSNPARKEFRRDDVLFGLCSLTFYSEHNASMGPQILYNVASSVDGVVCERLFYPEIKVERFLRNSGLPLFSLESKLSATDFDILAFTIFHIPEYLCLLEYLDLCKLPYKAEDRLNGRFPLVVGGGIWTLNPEPIAPFFDAICIGEGEDWLQEFLSYYKKNRALWECDDPVKKRTFLIGLAQQVEGTYVPLLTEVEYDDEHGKISRTVKDAGPCQERIRKRLCDITRQDSRFLKNVIMSRTEKEAFTKAIEVARGCRHGCRFCVVTAFYRPYRERPLEVLKEVIEYRMGLGIKQVGVGAPTPPDYSHISDLANFILEKGLRFDIQSERMDTFSYESARAHVLSGRRNVSLAIEAPDQFVRNQINKNLPEETIMQALSNGFRAGFKGIKLMFMLCHPWETAEQAHTFFDLLTKVFVLRERLNPRCFIRVSICPFIPKPWTSFQWAPLREAPELFDAANAGIELARRTPLGCHRFALQFAGGPNSRWFDTVFSRGDRRLADVFVLLHLHATPKDAMLYEFPYGAATKDCVAQIRGYCRALNLPLDRWLNGSPTSFDLPWDFVDIGISKKWLVKDWERARQGVENVSCKDGCSGCGACKTYSDLNLPHPNSYLTEPFKLDVSFKTFIEARRGSHFRNPRRQFVLYYTKSPESTRMNFQDFRRIVERCFSSCGVEVDRSSIDCLSHLFPGGMSWSGTDVVDVQAYVPLDCDLHDLKEKLFDSWKLSLGEITYFGPANDSFRSRLEGISVRFNCDAASLSYETVKEQSTLPFYFIRTERVSEKKSGEGIKSVKVNAMDYLFSFSLTMDRDVRLSLDMKRGGNAYEFAQVFFSVPRKRAESIPIEVLAPILRESWE
jgi:radical SAM superfamily enzyme YgiQ (UPF0313 family)